jgi:hypothetical protein
MSKVLLKTPKKKRGPAKRIVTVPEGTTSLGSTTYINVPRPPASAFNKNRPPGCLIQAQLQHISHAESARLPKEKRDGRGPEEFRTEGEAAEYIASVTRVLHPQKRRKRRTRTAKS